VFRYEISAGDNHGRTSFECMAKIMVDLIYIKNELIARFFMDV
jgi:hypothetical protein